MGQRPELAEDGDTETSVLRVLERLGRARLAERDVHRQQPATTFDEASSPNGSDDDDGFDVATVDSLEA